MLEFLQAFFLKFSFMGKYTNIIDNIDPTTMPIMFLIGVGIFLIFNIAHFWDSWDSDEYHRGVYIGSVIAYLIVNTIFLTVASLIAMSIFAMIGFLAAWVIGIFSGLIASFSREDGEDASIFGLIAIIKVYAKLLTKFIRYRKDTRKNYNKFLNFKY